MIEVKRHDYDITFAAGDLYKVPHVAVHLTERAGVATPLEEGQIGLEVRFSREGLSFDEKMQEAEALAKLLNEHIAGAHHTIHSRPSLELVAEIMSKHRITMESPLPMTEPAETTSGIMARLDLEVSGPKGRESSTWNKC